MYTEAIFVAIYSPGIVVKYLSLSRHGYSSSISLAYGGVA